MSLSAFTGLPISISPALFDRPNDEHRLCIIITPLDLPVPSTTMRTLLLLAALIATTLAGDATSCPPTSWDATGVPVEHTDEVCNRAADNDPERIDNVIYQLNKSVQTGAARQLKDEKTWYCPSEDFGEDNPRDGITGPPSLWILRNQASTPVVVSWVSSNKGGENLEVSAFNSDISPAHHDPKAIVQPGKWKTISMFLGHVFQVRELISVGGELAPGRILVRHRPGPHPIKNRFGGPKLSCPVQAIVDPQPDEDDGFDRTPFDYNRRCNALYAMFVNRMHCPVDVYWAGVDTSKVDANSAPTNQGKNETAPSSSCQERFSFHLGVNPAARTDYMDAWDSPVAYEATYLSHKFVARLRHDPDVVVDEVVLDRTYVRDCPRKKKVPSSAAVGDKEGVMTTTGITDDDKNDSVFITDVDAALSARKNTTSTVDIQSIAQNCTAKYPQEFIELVFGEKSPASMICSAAGVGAVSADGN